MPRAKPISKTPETMPEWEYRFDRVPAGEQGECFNYELEREIIRKQTGNAEPAWLTLSADQKRAFCSRSRIAYFSAQPEAVTSVPLFQSSPGQEVVELPPFTIDWTRSNTEIVESQSAHFKKWLLDQRKKRGQARRPNSGRPKSAWTWLVKLAIWRLRKMGHLSNSEIQSRLKKQQSQFAENLGGNIARWCREIDWLIS